MPLATDHFLPNRRKNSSQSPNKVWIPVLAVIALLCCESTPIMGGNHTGKWLTEVWPSALGQANTPFFGEVHHTLRKIGHFTAYGMLGLLLRNAWQRSVSTYMKMAGSQLRIASFALSVAFTFLFGCLDEWHQGMLPNRTSTHQDVLIDTGGALLFNAAFWLLRARRRRSGQSSYLNLSGISGSQNHRIETVF